MKINKNPKETFLELFDDELHNAFKTEWRHKIATIEEKDLQKIILIGEAFKNKRLIEFCNAVRESYDFAEGQYNYYVFFYEIHCIVQHNKRKREKSAMINVIKASFRTELEICNKYQEVFNVVQDYAYAMEFLDRARDEFQEVERKVEEDFSFEAIGQSLLEGKTAEREDFLPPWFYADCS